MFSQFFHSLLLWKLCAILSSFIYTKHSATSAMQERIETDLHIPANIPLPLSKCRRIFSDKVSIYLVFSLRSQLKKRVSNSHFQWFQTVKLFYRISSTLWGRVFDCCKFLARWRFRLHGRYVPLQGCLFVSHSSYWTSDLSLWLPLAIATLWLDNADTATYFLEYLINVRANYFTR